MKITLITNVYDLHGPGGGNQRTKCFFEAFKNLLGSENTLELVVIPYNYFDSLILEEVANLEMAQDIEFAIKLSWAVKNDEKNIKHQLSRIQESDFIIIDSCYHFPILEGVNKKRKRSSKVIYLSQNYEFNLKSEIADLLSWEPSHKKRYLDFLHELELKAWKDSDYRIACSTNDARNLNRDLPTPLANHIVPNGANKRNPSLSTREVILSSLGCDSYALFVSSGHPPNVGSFTQLLGDDFGFVPSNSRIVIVGTSGPIIMDRIHGGKYWETFRNRVSIFGQATDAELDDLYSYCSAVVVPILQGSGTSIKAIEAILTGKKVIGTEFAFRGLPPELYTSPQVILASNQFDFKLRLIDSFEQTEVKYPPNHIANKYLWESQAKNANNVFRNLLLGEAE
jgi:hypothetical protein